MLNFLPKFKNSKGITVIELLLVVSILMIIGTLSTAFYSRFLTQNSVDDTVNRLVGSFRKAQIYSMMGKQNNTWGVRYTAATKTITLYLTSNSAFDENFTHNNNITVNGFTDILFARITGTTTASSITVNGGNNSKTITINSAGVVSKQ